MEKLRTVWNWMPFLLGDIRLLYRKMYAEFFVFLGLRILLVFINVLLALWAPPLGMIQLADTTRILGSLFGDSLYQRKAYRVICKELDKPEEERMKVLQEKGGTNIWACLGWIVLEIGYLCLLYAR